MKTDLTPAGAPRVTRETADPQLPAIGEWYWVDLVEQRQYDQRWLGCVTHVGSNYAELTGVRPAFERRVHFDVFETVCVFEPNAEAIIARNIERHRGNAHRLMNQVKELTASLGVGQNALPAHVGGETAALAVRSGTPIKEYETALAKAKNETLPALFKKIREENEAMGDWMQAQLEPLKAQAAALEPAIERIKDRIFNVQLYAGLTEQVVLVRDGEPAPYDAPVHLLQRRAYMDEECLARYRTGGMEFNDLPEFDAWMAEPENCDRLLPHQRCVLAMQVRRYTKDRSDVSMRDFIRFLFDKTAETDKYTYLYIRNGAQVYRLRTSIEFGEQLFPDVERAALEVGHVYAKFFGSRVEKILTEGHFQELRREFEAEKREHEKLRAAWKVAKAAWTEQVNALKAQGLTPDTVPRGTWPSQPYEPWFHHSFERRDYVKWTPDSVHYDDIAAFVAKQIDQHNRMVLVLQGLFDRSPVFHPHPPVKLWEPASFQQALVLVYDDSRALTPGAAPDFEAYRSRLNATLDVGCVTVGQEDAWERREAERENERQARDYRIRNKSDYTRYRPYGDPGPGTLARVVSLSKKGATFRWFRERKRYDRWSDTNLPSVITVPRGELLNVSAYTPGDFRQFFDDPRTRADYLKWAPLLLEAEEWHAKNRAIRPVDSPFKCIDNGWSSRSFRPGSYRGDGL